MFELANPATRKPPASFPDVSLSLRAKDGGKEKGRETSGRPCFQDGGMFNGGRLRNF